MEGSTFACRSSPSWNREMAPGVSGPSLRPSYPVWPPSDLANRLGIVAASRYLTATYSGSAATFFHLVRQTDSEGCASASLVQRRAARVAGLDGALPVSLHVDASRVATALATYAS